MLRFSSRFNGFCCCVWLVTASACLADKDLSVGRLEPVGDAGIDGDDSQPIAPCAATCSGTVCANLELAAGESAGGYSCPAVPVHGPCDTLQECVEATGGKCEWHQLDDYAACLEGRPVAIVKIKEFDPLNPGDPYTDPSNIAPLGRVYFDGRLSHDPSHPADPTSISAWSWQIVDYPSGTDPGMFATQGQDASLFSFWVPLAGHYQVMLTVWNATGVPSDPDDTGRLPFAAIPPAKIMVQLTWDDDTNDQDIHLMKLPDAADLCDQPWDCYFANRQPVWFSDQALGEGGNPSLDIDDTNGFGPEAISVATPVPGTYRIGVHYWRGEAATRNTVNVYLNGVWVAEYKRTLNDQQKWLVADITWGADGTASVLPYASDSAGEVGTVASFATSQCSGI